MTTTGSDRAIILWVDYVGLLGRRPTMRQLAEEINVSPSRVSELVARGRRVCSRRGWQQFHEADPTGYHRYWREHGYETADTESTCPRCQRRQVSPDA